MHSRIKIIDLNNKSISVPLQQIRIFCILHSEPRTVNIFEMTTLTKVTNISFVLFCLIGLIFQLEQITERYFKFQTRSEVQLIIPIRVTVPMVSSCWKLKDIIDASKVSKSFDTPFKEYRDMREYYDKLDMLSVSDIFDATPDNISILTRVGPGSILEDRPHF